VGLLMVYAEDKDLFGAKEVALLEEAVADVSFALDVFASRPWPGRPRRRCARAKARLSLALDTNDTGVWDLDLLDHTAQRTLALRRIFAMRRCCRSGPTRCSSSTCCQRTARKWTGVSASGRDAVRVARECRILARDGEVRWSLTWAASSGIRGTPTRMAGLVQDITERKACGGDRARLNEQHEPDPVLGGGRILGLDEQVTTRSSIHRGQDAGLRSRGAPRPSQPQYLAPYQA